MTDFLDDTQDFTFTPQTATPEMLNGDAEARTEARRQAVQAGFDAAQETVGDRAQEFVKEPKRSRKAKEYENKTADILRFAMQMTVTSERTVTDAAALLTYGSQVAEKVGDLADQDPRVARMIDFINGGTENAYLNVAMVAMPLVLQVIRNHEPEKITAETTKSFTLFRRWTIKIPLRFKLRNKFFRNLTHEPKQLYQATFVPEVVEALQAQGVNVAAYKG